MGGVDGFDRLAAYVFAQIALKSNSYQQPLMFSMLLMCIGNCLACWRLAAREHDLEDASWPGLPLYIRRLRDSMTYEMFVVNLASGLLAHAGKAPLPNRTNMGGPGNDAVAAGVGGDDTDESIAMLKAKLGTIKQGKVRREWFASEDGQRFRLYCSRSFPHAVAHSSKSVWCVFCSRTIAVPLGDEPGEELVREAGLSQRITPRNKRRRVGGRTRHHCTTCNVFLCVPTNFNNMRDCFKMWHEEQGEADV